MARPSVKTANVLRVGLAVVTAFAVTTVKADEEPSGPPQGYRAGVLSAEFPYESNYIEILGSKMHYIDQGQGDVFLFLHGNPTSSYLWRNVMRYVAPQGRIVAVDLVHPNILGADSLGNSCHDFYPAAQARALSQWPHPASKQQCPPSRTND